MAHSMGAARRHTFSGSARNPFAARSGNPGMPSPFGSPKGDAQCAVTEDAPEDSSTHALVNRAPEVPAYEVKGVLASTVEVMIFWETTALHVQHLTSPRSSYVGEDTENNVTGDYFVPAVKLGATRAPLVLVDRARQVSVVLLPGARGTVGIQGQPGITVHQVISGGKALLCAELAGGWGRPPRTRPTIGTPSRGPTTIQILTLQGRWPFGMPVRSGRLAAWPRARRAILMLPPRRGVERTHPQPEDGIVTVTYPILFNRGGVRQSTGVAPGPAPVGRLTLPTLFPVDAPIGLSSRLRLRQCAKPIKEERS